MNTQSAVDTFVRETGGWVAAQLEACTRCGLCAEACHFYQATGEAEFAPVWKMEILRRAYEQRFTLGGRLMAAVGLAKPITDIDVADWSRLVYQACTLCNKCAMVCPMGIQLGPILHKVRTGMAAAGAVPEDLAATVQKQIDEGSPLGVTDEFYEDRLEWIEDEWEVELPIDKEGADTLVVFTSIEIMKFPTNVAAIARILNAAGESWTLSSSGREVVNFGFFEGDLDHTRLFMSRVYDAARDLGVKRIMVTECGHAYDAFRWASHDLMDVPEGLAITHIVEVCAELLEQGRLNLKAGAFDGDGTITFHDACKVQRRGGLIDEPRQILKALAPNAFQEMTPCREQNICCGGGGGVITIKEADPLRLGVFGLKKEQLEKVGAQTVCMACSNCRLQFTEGVAHYGMDVKVRGLAEMVAEALD